MLPEIGPVDREAGEFWVENPFLMPQSGKNLSAYERNCLFLNLNGTDFIDGSFASRADIDADSRSIVAGDFDRDGAIDLLVGSVGGGPLRLFRNRLPQMNRVKIDLVENNRAAIGARVVLHCGERRIVRDLFPVNGFMGQAPAELIVGVGTAEQIDRMTIGWPTQVGQPPQEFTDLPVNCQITITQGENKFQIAESFVR